MPIKKTDIAWLAAMIEAEGSIILQMPSSNGRHLCRVQVTNTDDGILCEVRRILEEWLVFYSIRLQSGKNKPCYRIEVNRQMEAKFVLEKVLPYLKSDKKSKAVMFINFVNTHTRKDGKALNIRKKVVQYPFI